MGKPHPKTLHPKTLNPKPYRGLGFSRGAGADKSIVVTRSPQNGVTGFWCTFVVLFIRVTQASLTCNVTACSGPVQSCSLGSP